MTGRKLAVLAASLAGGAVVIWTIVESLRGPGPAQRTADDVAADSPITRMVARVGPPDRTPSAWDGGWEAWARVAADLRVRDGLASGSSDGALGDRRGRPFWDAWARRVDGADGWQARMRSPAGSRSARRGDPALRGHPYRDPRTGVPTILTSGRRLGRADMRLPHSAAVSLGLDDQERVPVRVEVCVDRRGRPDEVRIVEGTGNDAVDAYVAREMLASRYRPLSRDGRRVGFCERTTVILGM